ncbi:MAG: hypothetical protein LPJ89_02235, partial [Hymenobacteraceae bacterium]|nr:hypothetical protein [Hymenobacteraceae bacterium]
MEQYNNVIIFFGLLGTILGFPLLGLFILISTSHRTFFSEIVGVINTILGFTLAFFSLLFLVMGLSESRVGSLFMILYFLMAFGVGVFLLKRTK